MAAELTFDELLALAEESDDVLGLYLFGSRGRQLMVDERSDWDVCVVLRDDEALGRFDAEYPYVHGARVEIASTTLTDLRESGSIGSSSEWGRYAAAHVEVLVDKTDGEIVRIVEEKEWIPAAERGALVRDALDAYVNSTYRSLRYGTRLDATESLSPALRTIFGLAGRVRPFNKYLDWELRNHPLEGWDADTLLRLVDGIADGDRAAQHELFRLVEVSAREGGFAAVIDSWEPDVAWLRGEVDYRCAR